MWASQCNCVLAAEQPRYGLCCLLGQPEWTWHFLHWHTGTHTVCCLWNCVRYSVQCLGEGFGSPKQQYWQHHHHSYNRWYKWTARACDIKDFNICTKYTPSAAPCHVSSIRAVTDCEADSAVVSWQPSSGAVSYITELTAASGHVTSCAANDTNCELSSVQCGEEYNVTVKAVGDACNSTAQLAGYLLTGTLYGCVCNKTGKLYVFKFLLPLEPCASGNLSVNYNLSVAKVMWLEARGASSYSVQAVTSQGLTAACNTSRTDCFVNGLQCGQIYNVTVTAHNQACNNTVVSECYRLLTGSSQHWGKECNVEGVTVFPLKMHVSTHSEPCPPTAVQASVDCEQLNSTVSWQQSDLAVGYVAYFKSQNGHRISCVARDTNASCHVSELTCGTVYHVWVKALGQQYNSSDSTVFSLTSGENH